MKKMTIVSLGLFCRRVGGRKGFSGFWFLKKTFLK